MNKPTVLGPRLFTLHEAERILPLVRTLVTRFQALHETYEECARELAVLRLVSSSGGDDANPDLSALREKERQDAALLREMRRVQARIQAAGCVVKSYENGLVDFFALKGGRLVFLCWKQGEAGIGGWHTLEGGYSRRMPLETFAADSAPDDAAGL